MQAECDPGKCNMLISRGRMNQLQYPLGICIDSDLMIIIIVSHMVRRESHGGSTVASIKVGIETNNVTVVGSIKYPAAIKITPHIRFL